MTKKKILGASIENDVHVAGVLNFLELAKREGYETIFIGNKVPIKTLIQKIKEYDPYMVAIGYRLGVESFENILKELLKEVKENGLDNRKYLFGGPTEVAKVAEKSNFFEKVFSGKEDIEDIILFLRDEKRRTEGESIPPQTLWERINYKYPYPLYRHHIGLETLEKTVKEIEKLADANIIDIISIAPDQNTQEWFFQPEKMDETLDGAGGVPLRSKKDFELLYRASRKGNYPLMRCYAGTNNLLEFSKLLKETINNAWAAIPLTWYSELDRRSQRSLEKAIKENQEAIKWNAQNGIPVEINESHQWGLRYAHDALEVAISYIVAYNAKKLGVKHYVMQYMFETPPGLSPKMDMAKMLAKIELIKTLEDDNFIHYRMIRTGLMALPAHPWRAIGEMASSVFFASYIKPHIIHVVSYCEAEKRAESKEIIESINMAKQAYRKASKGLPNFEKDPKVKARIELLKEEAHLIIQAIKNIGDKEEDPLIAPNVLTKAIKIGILDAPGLKGSVAKGDIITKIVDGANYVTNEEGKIIPERKRLEKLGVL